MKNRRKPPGRYLYQGKLDSTIHDLAYNQMQELAQINKEEIEENQKVTASTCARENYYGKYDFHVALNREYLYRDKKTDGMCTYAVSSWSGCSAGYAVSLLSRRKSDIGCVV